MTSPVGTALARLTIKTPKRCMDVALPDDVAVTDLLPYILRHAGEDVADAGERHGGWVLRWPLGVALDPRRSLSAQDVVDGNELHLVPGEVEWPELEYDDIVEAVASGARRYGRSWGKLATRRCGLGACAVILLTGTLMTLLFEPPWLVPGMVLLSVAVVLLALGTVIGRAVPDTRAGVAFGGASLPYAFLGGFVVTGPDHSGLGDLGSPQLLLGSVGIGLFGLAGYVAVAALSRVFAAGVAIGLLGTVGALAAGPLDPDAAAAVTLTVGIALLPAYPLLAIRLGRLPRPSLPQRASEFLEDDASPAPPAVFAAAARTDEILSGLLTGLSVVCVVCAWFLVSYGGGAGLVMLGVVAAALLLRARLFGIPRQRVPLLVSGAVVAAGVLAALSVAAEDNTVRTLYVWLVAAAAGLIGYAGMVYSKHNPSPYLGRLADIGDVLAVLALVPLTALITGLFTYIQGVMAGVG